MSEMRDGACKGGGHASRRSGWRRWSVLTLASILGAVLSACGGEDASGPGNGDGSADGTFTVVLMPDTQSYVAWKPEMLSDQTRWIADNAEGRRILFVAHEGDIVQSFAGDEDEWLFTRDCFADLDAARIPWAVIPGNHDYAENSRDSTAFETHYPLSLFESMPTFGGAFEAGKSDNTFHLLEVDGARILFLMLEFGPRDAVVDWADTVAAAHPKHLVFVVTHAHISETDALLGPDDPLSPTNGYGLGDANDGIGLWNDLIKRNPNIAFVASGHVGTATDGAGNLVWENEAGGPVYQMMANFQYHPLGDSGYLRLLEFRPREGRILVETFSPTLGLWKTDPDNEFEITDVPFLQNTGE